MSYIDKIEQFKQNILSGGVLDPENVHHEFASGMHGRKLDFDVIPDDSALFSEWIDVITATIQEFFSDKLQDIVLVSVANGTNRVVPLVAQKLGNGASYLLTEKETPKSAKLTAEALKAMADLHDRFFIVIEDVGTKGTTSASAVRAMRAAGGSNIQVINTWQRRETLEELDATDVPYRAVIKELLPTYTPEECQDHGLCATGARYIEHAK